MAEGRLLRGYSFSSPLSGISNPLLVLEYYFCLASREVHQMAVKSKLVPSFEGKLLGLEIFRFGLIAILLSTFLVGCSDSPTEKRNSFDACVTDWLVKNGYNFIGYNGYMDGQARAECNYLLK